jgi:hypothetical protein
MLKTLGKASAHMSRGLRIARWAGLAAVVLLAGRGLLAILFDVLESGIDDLILHPKTSGGWTAFERYISYNWIADVDRYLYLARSTKDRSTWIQIAPGECWIDGEVEWVTPNVLRVPTEFKDGCLTRVNEIVIEWKP